MLEAVAVGAKNVWSCMISTSPVLDVPLRGESFKMPFVTVCMTDVFKNDSTVEEATDEI